MEPVMHFILPLFLAAGGITALIGGWISTAQQHYAILALLMIIASTFSGAMREENGIMR